MRVGLGLVLALGLTGAATAEQMDHGAHAGHEAHAGHGAMATPMQEVGQSAFATIQEIVTLLEADPATDWSKVDIDGLRRHLLDMDNVIMRAKVKAQPIRGGMAFIVSSEDPEVIASIQRMVVAHAAVMDGVGGMEMRAAERPYGAMLGVEGDEARIKGLGFFGIMASGMHHQAHHLAIARGMNPHH